MSSEKKGKKKSIIRRVGFVVLVIYVCFMLVDMQVTLAERNEELSALKNQHELQRIENKDLQRQLSIEYDDEEIERIAREQLEYVAPDEKVFIDISGS